MTPSEESVAKITNQIATIFNNPKFSTLLKDNPIAIMIGKTIENRIAPKIEGVFRDFNGRNIDSKINELIHVLIPELESITESDIRKHVEFCIQLLRSNRRSILLLNEFFYMTQDLIRPSNIKLQNREYYAFVSIFENCLEIQRPKEDGIHALGQIALGLNEKFWINNISAASELSALEEIQKEDRHYAIRKASNILGKFISIMIEYIASSMSSIISLAEEKISPNDFRPRIDFITSFCLKKNIEIEFIKLETLCFVRNATSHGGVAFDYSQNPDDIKIKLTNKSKRGEETRDYTMEEIEELIIHAMSVSAQFGEFIRYVAYRFSSGENARKHFVKEFIKINLKSDLDNEPT